MLVAAAVMLSVEEGSDREQWRLLHSLPVFSHSLPYPQSNWALLVLIPEWMGSCMFGTPWVSPRKSPVRLGVSPAASTPTGVFNQWFEALFPHAGALGCMVCRLVPQVLPHRPVAAWPALFHNPPPRWLCQPPPYHESSLPGCPSPPLLLVWVSVSSLFPWLSDFHTV